MKLLIMLKSQVTSMVLYKFFKKNPHPTDDTVHEFAEHRGLSPHVLEQAVYGLLSDHIAPKRTSKASQRARGIKIEAEHKPTFRKIEACLKANGKLPPDEQMQEWIHDDHMVEGDYYDFLEPMEQAMKGGTGG